MNLFIFITLLVLLISSTQGNDVFKTTGYNMEISQQIATAFLSNNIDFLDYFPEDSPDLFFKSRMGKDCVPCKFGLQPCCAPNICVKKTLLPDECQDVKSAQ